MPRKPRQDASPRPAINVLDHGGLIALAIKSLPPHCKRYLTYDDMFQIGWVALLKAAQYFDPDYGVQWSTYAVASVYRLIVQEVYKTGSLIKVPVSLTNRKGSRGADWFEAASKVHARSLLYEQRSHGHDGTKQKPGYATPAADGGQDAHLEQVGLRDEIEKALAVIPKRQAEIIRMRFLQCMTLQEVAAKLRLTRERVRQIQLDAMDRLRPLLKGKF